MVNLGTKAENLARLRGKLTYAEILPQVSFTVAEWRAGRESIWKKCLVIRGEEGKLIVRSSAVSEDTYEGSQAGRFQSIGGVKNEQEFLKAVDAVIASYENASEKDQVLVQPMLEAVKACGVAFTIDPNSLGNYYVINYDESGSTSTVTSGNGVKDKLLYLFKGKEQKGDWPEYIHRLCRTLQELEELSSLDKLDVEFAVDNEEKLYIFQVRPLCAKGKTANRLAQQKELERIEAKIRQGASKKPYLCGNRNIYGVMSDWNPAEMIGIRPKALAMSLYREVITDSVWAYQRDNYGYRNMRSFPLMVDFGGLPYIDIRVSFNSFVPAGLDEDTSNKLVNYYLERLAGDPSKHDKVEFDIVFSCYTLDLPERIQILKEYGFSEAEIGRITDALRDVTNQVISPTQGLWRKDMEKIGILVERYSRIMDSSMCKTEKIYWLLEDCKRYGTLPFAGLARGAFIAVQMLNSMVKMEIISGEDYHDFMNDVETVSSNMNRDYASLSKEEFLGKYGHLRPGTYDINSLRYDEAPELYFDWTSALGSGKEASRPTMGGKVDGGREGKRFSLSLEQMHKLKDLLERSGLKTDILGLMDFIKTVIEAREYGKFIFTRSLSKAIQLIGELGAEYGLSREDCAYVDIQAVRGLYASTREPGSALRESAAKGKAEYRMTESLVLPPVLLDASEVWGFYYPDAEPNYITLKQAHGEVVEIVAGAGQANLDGKIVLIACADPGYDWIFSRHMKGFITMYGGANSHMAIRAGELGIPAVIGVGEKRYNDYRVARALEIDAAAKQVRVL